MVSKVALNIRLKHFYLGYFHVSGISVGTSDGTTNMIEYTHNVTHNIITISLQFRTRTLKGIMLHIRGVGVHSDRYITVEIDDKMV